MPRKHGTLKGSCRALSGDNLSCVLNMYKNQFAWHRKILAPEPHAVLVGSTVLSHHSQVLPSFTKGAKLKYEKLRPSPTHTLPPSPPLTLGKIMVKTQDDIFASEDDVKVI